MIGMNEVECGSRSVLVVQYVVSRYLVQMTVKS